LGDRKITCTDRHCDAGRHLFDDSHHVVGTGSHCGRGNWFATRPERRTSPRRHVAERNQELLISAKLYWGRHRSEIEHEPDGRLEDIDWPTASPLGRRPGSATSRTAFTSSQTEHGGQEAYTVHEVSPVARTLSDAFFTESYTQTSVVRGSFRKKAEARADALEQLRAA